MGAHIAVKEGTGHCCYICGEPIKKTQIEIVFRGWNASAIIHSDYRECANREVREDGKV